MDEREFQVEVSYRQTVRYRITAPDREAAEALAMERWQAGDEGIFEDEGCYLEAVHVNDPAADAGCGQDCDDALRFLRDRELVIETLDEDAFNPTVHDAVSAEEVARHLGWQQEDGEIDLKRAAWTLDRLCTQRRVICFDRPRVRRGERGSIRLYCTPQHLERLSALLDEDVEVAEPAGEEVAG